MKGPPIASRRPPGKPENPLEFVPLPPAYHPYVVFISVPAIGRACREEPSLFASDSPIPSAISNVIHSPSVGTCQPVGHQLASIVHRIPIVQAAVFVQRPRRDRRHRHRGTSYHRSLRPLRTPPQRHSSVDRPLAVGRGWQGWRRHWRNAPSAGSPRTNTAPQSAPWRSRSRGS